MSINGLSISNLNGIDVKNVNKVTENIFASLENKTVDVSKVDLTRFTRATQGVDLYSNKVSLDVQRQISMTNAGLNEVQMNLSSVQALNASAAANLYNVDKNVNGNMTIFANEAVEQKPVLEELSQTMNVFETQKDKKGSNPFSFFSQNQKEEAAQQPLNIVA